jgi:hypothetical protein
VSNYDFLPSVLGHLGLGDKMPQQPKSPGRDFSPALRGEKLANWDNTVFYEMETTRAIRTERWKYVARFPDGPFELYDMQSDPQERFNLFGQPGTDEPSKPISPNSSTPSSPTYADPKYDIWKGGGSKAKLHTSGLTDNRMGEAKLIGVIELVNPEQNYVLINCEQRLNIPAGTEIVSQGADGSKCEAQGDSGTQRQLHHRGHHGRHAATARSRVIQDQAGGCPRQPLQPLSRQVARWCR